MITKAQAAEMVLEFLNKEMPGLDLQVMNDLTRDEDFGWMFFYQSKKYVETGDDTELVGGNAPLIVDAKNGNLVVTGTRLDEEDYIALYQQFRNDLDAFEIACRDHISR